MESAKTSVLVKQLSHALPSISRCLSEKNPITFMSVFTAWISSGNSGRFFDVTAPVKPTWSLGVRRLAAVGI
jgi:hypothetical protein